MNAHDVFRDQCEPVINLLYIKLYTPRRDKNGGFPQFEDTKGRNPIPLDLFTVWQSEMKTSLDF